MFQAPAARAPLRGRADYKVWRRIGTRWSDNDLYGHVNNTIYYAWFDTAVNSWLIDSGLLDIAGGDLIGVVVETGCRYAASLCFPASVDVGLAVSRIGTSSVRYDVGVFGKDEEAPAAEGFFVHVHVDRQSRRPKALPPGWRVAFESIMR